MRYGAIPGTRVGNIVGIGGIRSGDVCVSYGKGSGLPGNVGVLHVHSPHNTVVVSSNSSPLVQWTLFVHYVSLCCPYAVEHMGRDNSLCHKCFRFAVPMVPMYNILYKRVKVIYSNI